MKNLINKLWRDRRGNVIVIMAAMLPLVIGCAGLATDTIQWTLWKRQLQRAADSAALAGVYDRIASAGATTTVSATVTHDLALNNHSSYSLLTGYPQIDTTNFSPANPNATNPVRVTLAVRQSLPFSSMFMTAIPTITATSTAASVPGSGEYCVVALENSSSQSGITIGGSAAIDMDCGMISNSPATNSALSNGVASVVKATVIAAVGGVQSSKSWTVGSYEPYTSAIVDPYASVPVPTPSGCTNFPATNNLDFTANPAHASGQVVCYKSDMKIQGNVKLGSATYVLDAASVKMSSTGASLSCSGCTIILTSSTASSNPGSIGTVSISGGSVNMTAPSSGTYKGMVFYQDRRAVDSASNKDMINGNSGSTVEGTIYFPSQELTYNGDGTTTALCTQFVTRRIIFSGNNTTSNKYTATSCGNKNGGTIAASRHPRLVA
jgi:Flp pilus assembly protein TadG